MNIKKIIEKADYIRKDLVAICVKNAAGHIAPSLSSVDILTALYYGVMDISANPQWKDRDRLIFSKAHGGYALYAILADIGYINKRDWENFYKGSFLSGCVERSVENGMEASCGSLGHGLPQAVGIAFAAKLQKLRYRVYCVVGDGELQEGANWEAIQFAVKHRLSHLTVIVDKNGLQAMDYLENILTPKGRRDDIKIKMKAFGCEVRECDGHKIPAMIKILKNWRKRQRSMNKPQVLIANTTKGYGLICMEDVPKFHFRLPTSEEIEMGKRYE